MHRLIFTTRWRQKPTHLGGKIFARESELWFFRITKCQTPWGEGPPPRGSPEASPGSITRWGGGPTGWAGGGALLLWAPRRDRSPEFWARGRVCAPHPRPEVQGSSPPPAGPGHSATAPHCSLVHGLHLRGDPTSQASAFCAPGAQVGSGEAGRPRPRSPACVDFLRAFLMSSSVLLLSLISSCWVFTSRSLCRSVRAFRAWGPTTRGSCSRGPEPGRPRRVRGLASPLLGRSPLLSPCSWTSFPSSHPVLGPEGRFDGGSGQGVGCPPRYVSPVPHPCPRHWGQQQLPARSDLPGLWQGSDSG